MKISVFTSLSVRESGKEKMEEQAASAVGAGQSKKGL